MVSFLSWTRQMLHTSSVMCPGSFSLVFQFALKMPTILFDEVYLQGYMQYRAVAHRPASPH